MQHIEVRKWEMLIEQEQKGLQMNHEPCKDAFTVYKTPTNRGIEKYLPYTCTNLPFTLNLGENTTVTYSIHQSF